MDDLPILAAYDRSALRDALDALRPAPCAVADLSRGGWGAQSLATQWLGQILGRDVTPRNDAPPIEQLYSLGRAMGAGIDEESRGNRSLTQAFGAAQQLARLLARVPTALVVLTPGHGFGWRRDDRLLLEYLLELAPDITVTLIVTAPPGAPRFVPPSSPALALPTALSPALRELVDPAGEADLLILDNGWAIAAPGDRNTGGAPFDQAALARFAHPRLAPFLAFAMLHAEEDAVASWQLCFEAWRQCHSGYREVAPELMDTAIARAPEATSEAALRAQRQAMRIADAAFVQAADEPAPAAEVPPDVAGFIEECRGWGMVMANRPQEALTALRRAMALLVTNTPDKAQLLLMNIAALAEQRSGYTEQALTLEREIEARLPDLPGANGELTFVNSINLARLRRYAECFDDAERYYRRAFDTFEGARTETDQVNVDLCLARLAMARGDADAAFDHWIRAALQWVANRCPEALNWRVQALVIGNGRRISIQTHTEAAALVEQLAAGFVLALDDAARAAGHTLGDDEAPMRHFLPSDRARIGLVPLRLLGGTGWSVVAATTCEQPRHQGEAMQRLRRRLSGWIAAQWPTAGENAYLIDRRDGTGMPGTPAEQVASAADHGVDAIHLPAAHGRLDESDIATLRDARIIRLSPIVAEIERDRVHFRRYMQPLSLMGIDAAIVAAAQAGWPVGRLLADQARQGRRESAVRQALDALREKHVVQLRAITPDMLDDLRGKPTIANEIAWEGTRTS